MKDTTLKTLKTELRTIDARSLDQFFIAVLEEIRRRNPKRRRPLKSPRRVELKDCEPIRGY